MSLAVEEYKPKKKKNRYVVPVAIAAGTVVVGGLTFWAIKKKNFGDSVVITQKITTKVLETKNYLLVNVPQKFELTIVATVKNPSNASATLTQPYVEMRLNEADQAPFSSSQVSNKTFKIEAQSEKTFDPITLVINTSDLLSRAGDILKTAIKNKKLGLYTRTLTYLVTGVTKIAVPKDDKTELTF